MYGNGADKELTDLVPGILSQLGPDSLASLRKLAESYQAMNAAQMAQAGGAEGANGDDDGVPDVVSISRESVVYCRCNVSSPDNSLPLSHSQPTLTRPARQARKQKTRPRPKSRSSTKRKSCVWGGALSSRPQVGEHKKSRAVTGSLVHYMHLVEPHKSTVWMESAGLG